jgi:uncharacterized protein
MRIGTITSGGIVKAKQIARGATATYVVVLDEGEEAFSALSDFAARQQLTAAQVTAVGAFERATVGWFDRAAKDYRHIEITEQCEVLSLVGDIALGSGSRQSASRQSGEGQPQPHLHTVLGLADGTTRGGHLLQGSVWPTLEVIIREAPAELRKTHRPEMGLALIDLDKT